MYDICGIFNSPMHAAFHCTMYVRVLLCEHNAHIWCFFGYVYVMVQYMYYAVWTCTLMYGVFILIRV